MIRPAAQKARRYLVPGLAVVVVALVLVVIAVLEGDIPEALTDVRGFVQSILQRYGAAGSFVLLYLEESGIPLPVPGDVYVAYLGRSTAGNTFQWLAAWLGIILVVVGGSTNLYMVSRRWGRRLLEHRVAALFHLDRERIATAEQWFSRWGMLAIIFGRHVPGLRVPITVAAGIARVPYRVFSVSVAISTAVWAGVWLWLGAHFGPSIGHFFSTHAWALALAAGVVIAFIALLAVGGWRGMATSAGDSTH